jgi:hypothetical protein
MLRENPKASGPADLYRAQPESIIDLSHELVKLTGKAGYNCLQKALSVYWR